MGICANKDYNLTKTHPEVIYQWDYERNGDLKPEHLTPGSDKKAFFKCEKGHSWKTSIKVRTRGRGCPYCLGSRITGKESLKGKYPQLAKEWDKVKNGTLSPAEVAPGSHKAVWWRCKKGHSWKTVVKSRALSGTGCPYCSGRKFSPENSLWRNNRALALQWHPIKNGTLRPKDISVKSERKVWWRCKKGHEWRAAVGPRNRGNGCPYCAGRAVGKENSLATMHPELALQWHKTKNGKLTPHDVTPGSNTRVWWKCSKKHSWQTDIVTRVKAGTGCPYCANHLPSAQNNLQKVNPKLASQWHPEKNGDLTPRNTVARYTKKVWWRCSKGHEWMASPYKRMSGRGCPYCSHTLITAETSFAAVNPEQSAFWHPKKNGSLKPTDVFPWSTKKVWWLCMRGHEWKAMVSSLNGGSCCPYCSGRIPLPKKSLAVTHPYLAKQWHSEKNGSLTPEDVTELSTYVVWWKRGKRVWREVIKHRARREIR
ncbi:zinc-ribbon domain-containing protein [Chitinispirillales bacterium ANBcel5]|uniref:zinc-ribbon domain-containing protein n=1 Tax=Cellulosispirillum alkaliphilum TaxID=3039283 RepID=UPI002A51B630|nr:zinc-ribbon domain-containing protein [Chitinispirillales bacterium ANBcel5]